MSVSKAMIRRARRCARTSLRGVLRSGRIRRAAFTVLKPAPRSGYRLSQIIASERPELSLRVRSGALAGSTFVELLPAELMSLHDNTMERAIADFIAQLPLAGAAVLDLGASYGYYSVLLSRLVGPSGHVWAFEPGPAEFERLRRNLKVNGCLNATPLSVAASSDSGLMHYRPDPMRPWLGRLIGDDEASKDATTLVPTTSIDQFVGATGTQPSFLKVDVEGEEVRVLAGCVELIKSGAQFLIEAHSSENAELIHGQFDAYGYQAIEVEVASPIRQHLFFSKHGSSGSGVDVTKHM